MKSRILCTAAVASTLVLAALGCKSSDVKQSQQSSSMNLTGAGSTFVYPIYSRWFSEYGASHPNVHINYQSIGSGGGIRQVSQLIVDFGASDGPMNDAQLKAAKAKILQIPTVLGAVVPSYNIPGITADLNFAPDVIADIYLGKITEWNDPRIVKDNPGVKLPAQKILPVYRSDGSGTTYIFTDYLSKVSPDFASKIGKNTSVSWPMGIGEKGNEGVAGMIRNSPYAFGYIELTYAMENKMAYGQVRNSAGKWVKGSTTSVTAAAAAMANDIPADYRVSITNASGDASYPISSFTWLLIPIPPPNAAKGKVLHDFLEWMLDHGESEASSMAYAPLPTAVADRVRQSIQQVQ